MARRVLTDPAARRGRASRTKGAKFERDVAERFRAVVFGGDDAVKRGIGQARSGGEVADVQTPYFWVECKKRRGVVNIPKALLQATEAVMKPGTECKVPLVVAATDRNPPIAAMYLEDLLPILEEWWRLRGGR